MRLRFQVKAPDGQSLEGIWTTAERDYPRPTKCTMSSDCSEPVTAVIVNARDSKLEVIQRPENFSKAAHLYVRPTCASHTFNDLQQSLKTGIFRTRQVTSVTMTWEEFQVMTLMYE
jgi:hypothetical protein